MDCYLKTPPRALSGKGIGRVLECLDVGKELANPLADIGELLVRLLGGYLSPPAVRVEFSENEPIGTNYVLYKYHAFDGDRFVASCRAVVRRRVLEEVVCTFDSSQVTRVSGHPLQVPGEPKLSPASARVAEPPPGQFYIDHFIIYRILGTPRVDAGSWRLRVSGTVENPLELSLDDVERLPRVSLVRDFHCVTGWSVPSVSWEGVELRLIAEMARPREGARWVLVSGLDGYSAVVPLEDFVSEEALLVLRMNGRPLSVEQGFPARIFIPHLYGWKSVKWVSRIEFTERYVDGYWEALGYHERGNVSLEERFKGPRAFCGASAGARSSPVPSGGTWQGSSGASRTCS